MLDKKKLELNTLGQINSSLINRWTLSELLDSVVERLDQLYPVEICTIRLLCEEEDVLLLKASSGRLKEHVLEGEIPLRGDVLETCLREKRMVHIRDFEMGMLSAYDDNLLQFQQDPEGVFIPLENEGRIIGLLTLIVGDRLSGENLEIFKTFGLQVSLAIERTRTYEKLKEEYFKTLEVMIAAIEAKDEYTKGHSRRVARVASLLARQLDYTDEEIEMVETAGLLHDIGKIGVPDAVLTKKGKLEAQEYELMKQHPLLGEAILAPIGLPEMVVDGIRYHHKRYDGTGYPEERQIERLDPISEIIGVADAFDAMTSKRSYTANRTIEEAMDELIRCAGSQFSPLVVKAMVSLIEEEKPKIEKAMEDEDSV
jgi:putative nucleotidyltransferase with HDIG domain